MDEKTSITAWSIIVALQCLTIVFVFNIPTEPAKFACRGIYENPDAIMCYEQK